MGFSLNPNPLAQARFSPEHESVRETVDTKILHDLSIPRFRLGWKFVHWNAIVPSIH